MFMRIVLFKQLISNSCGHCGLENHISRQQSFMLKCLALQIGLQITGNTAIFVNANSLQCPPVCSQFTHDQNN